MAVSTISTTKAASWSRSAVSRSRATQRPATQLRTPMQFHVTGSRIQHPMLYPKQQQRGLVCHGLFGLGLPELAVIAGVTALIFGPSKLPELGKGLGKTVKSFQSAAKEFKSELEAAAAADEDPAAKVASQNQEAASKEEAGKL